MTTHLYLIHAFSPIHCGTGQAVSGIDLPIAREKPTGIPLVPGSSIKGVLRASALGYAGPSAAAKDVHLAAFGPETEHAADYAGAVVFSDANLLFLPIRSVRGTFAWVTSPYLLQRLARDVKEAKVQWTVPSLNPADAECAVAGEALIVSPRERVLFDDFDFEPKRSKEMLAFAQAFATSLYGTGTDASAEAEHFKERVAVVSDNVMRILAKVGMEVTARNRINSATKTVERGALWTEEALPIESVLVGLFATTPVQRGKQLAQHDDAALVSHVRSLCQGSVQLGGKSSIGRGVCRLRVL